MSVQPNNHRKVYPQLIENIEDWPIYLAYLLLSTILFLPGLEIMPGIRFAIAEMAATVGFIYVGGLPIIVLH